MIIQCGDCGRRFDDEYRWTICPHETFAANDGRNNFAHHPESHLDSANARPILERQQRGAPTYEENPKTQEEPEPTRISSSDKEER